MRESDFWHRESTRVSVNSRSEVHEHRAPTDDSVRLLREMEQRVRDEVVKTTIVRDTDFECVVYKTADLMMGDTAFAIVYSLGGKKHRTEYRASARDQLDIDDVSRGIRDAVARDIASVMLASAFNKVKEF